MRILVLLRTSILKDYLNVTVSITKCLRIGKKHDDANKPRLLKITVGSVDEKIEVMESSQFGVHP